MTQSRYYSKTGCDGLVLRKEDNDWVKKCMDYEVEGARPRGRPKRLCRKTVRCMDWTGRML